MRAMALVVLTLAWASLLGGQEPDASLIAEGRKVFEGRSGGALCFSCHGMNARGMPGMGPDLTDGKWLHGDGGRQFLETVIRAGVLKPKQSAVSMPPLGGAKLDSAQVRAVAAYVASLNARR